MRYFTFSFCTESLKSRVYVCPTFQFRPTTYQVVSGHRCLVATVMGSMAVDCKLYRQDWCCPCLVIATVYTYYIHHSAWYIVGVQICQIELKYIK